MHGSKTWLFALKQSFSSQDHGTDILFIFYFKLKVHKIIIINVDTNNRKI